MNGVPALDADDVVWRPIIKPSTNIKISSKITTITETASEPIDKKTPNRSGGGEGGGVGSMGIGAEVSVATAVLPSL